MARRVLRQEEFADTEENVDLIFEHLKQTGRLAQGIINTSGILETRIVKLAPVGATLQSSEISTEEKAPFQLGEMISQLDRDIHQRALKVQEMNHQIKQLAKSNERRAALRLLQ